MITELLILFAAQTFTIPQGTTVWGPWQVQIANKYASFSFDRTLWTNPAITLVATADYSTDKGSTWNPIPGCKITSQGGGTPPTTFFNCMFPQGTTDIRATTIVSGGSITIPSQPTGGPK